MSDTVATMAKKPAQSLEHEARPQDSGENTSLDCRYRQIGISAVAAAARYHGMAKNPAYAPVARDWHQITEEAAA